MRRSNCENGNKARNANTIALSSGGFNSSPLLSGCVQASLYLFLFAFILPFHCQLLLAVSLICLRIRSHLLFTFQPAVSIAILLEFLFINAIAKLLGAMCAGSDALKRHTPFSASSGKSTGEGVEDDDAQ
jgi:hypothetical protein